MSFIEARFWSHVDRSGGPDSCWPWIGATAGGYGVVRIDKKLRRASRIALSLALGRPLAPGEQALHHCDNPPCANTGPEHLFAGTQPDNIRDMFAKGRGRKPSGPTPEQRARGERQGCAKLTAQDIVAIRALRATGLLQREIASRFGVGRPTVKDILSGHTWAHV